MGPLPKGISHIMRIALLAPRFRDLDLAREPILFLSPPSGGESLIGVTTTLVTSISSATTASYESDFSEVVVSVDTPSSSEV